MRAGLLAAALVMAGSASIVATPAGASTTCERVAGKSVVAVVVQQAGSAPGVTCVVVEPGASGVKVLLERVAQFGKPDLRWHQNGSGLLCGIDALPVSGCGEAIDGVPNYWSYWWDDGGSWRYADLGPGFHIADGDGDGVEVIGWRFVSGAASQTGTELAPTLSPSQITFLQPGSGGGEEPAPAAPTSPRQSATDPSLSEQRDLLSGQPSAPSAAAAAEYFRQLAEAASGGGPGQYPGVGTPSTVPSAVLDAEASAAGQPSEPSSGSSTTSVISAETADETVVLEQAAAAADAGSTGSSPAPLAALALIAAAVGVTLVAVRARRRT